MYYELRGDARRYIGLSTDPKPTYDAASNRPRLGDEFYETDTGQTYVWVSGETESWTSKPAQSVIDFTGEITIEGRSVNNLYIEAANTGANTLLSVGASERVKLYKVLITVESDVVGLVKLTVGSTDIAGIYSPKAGGQYVLVSNYPDYYYGGLGEDVVLTTPDSTDIHVQLSYVIE